jgi:hypothetical protein
MAYDENLADRVRTILMAEASLSERKMFGGLAFMIDGHMCCGIVGRDLMLRLGPDGSDAARARPHVRPMAFTGRTMASMILVEPEGLRGVALRRWIEEATTFVRTLPPKR